MGLEVTDLLWVKMHEVWKGLLSHIAQCYNVMLQLQCFVGCDAVVTELSEHTCVEANIFFFYDFLKTELQRNSFYRDGIHTSQGLTYATVTTTADIKQLPCQGIFCSQILGG